MPRKSTIQKDTDTLISPSKSSRTSASIKGCGSKLYEKISQVKAKIKHDHDVQYIGAPVSQTQSKSRKRSQKTVSEDLDDFIVGDTIKRSKKAKIEDDEEKPKSRVPRFVQAMLREPPRCLGQLEIPVGKKNCLAGLTFVITGILEYFDRDDIVSLVQRYGGRVTSAVSGRTSFLIKGREPGESKIAKVKELKTKILEEEEFYAMISDTKPQEKKPYEKQEKAPIKEKTLISIENKMMKNELQLWVDKYSPKRVSQIVGQHGAKSPANKLIFWLQNWHKSRKTKAKNFFAAKEDGSLYKAVLISGQPGVGKSTTARLVCKELYFDYIEMNASDARNKKHLKEMLSVCLNNMWFNNPSEKSAVIMDEVDGMSGNEDRGGLQELIAMISKTHIPIICICNDRSHKKIRPIMKNFFDLRFHKPRIEQIRAFVTNIAAEEGINIEPQAIDQITQASQNDIRSVLNTLQMSACTKQNYSYDDTKSELLSSKKDLQENVFDIARKAFNKINTAKFDIKQKSDLFFVDYSLMSLFIQENYLVTANVDKGLKRIFNVRNSSNSISLGEICETKIRTGNNWSLLPTQAVLSLVYPTEYTAGAIMGAINFPQWLGKNSTTNKHKNMSVEVVNHSRLKTNISRRGLILDYVPYFYKLFYHPILENDIEGVGAVIKLLDDYDFDKEDWDSLTTLYQWSTLEVEPLSTKLKSAFTRAFKKHEHMLPYNTDAVAKKSTVNGEDFDEDEEIDDLSDKESPKQIPFLVKPKAVKAKTVKTKIVNAKPVKAKIAKASDNIGKARKTKK